MKHVLPKFTDGARFGLTREFLSAVVESRLLL